MRLKDEAIFSVRIGDERRRKKQLKGEQVEKGERLHGKEEIYWGGKKMVEKWRKKLLICFTPTPPPQLNCNRGDFTLFARHEVHQGVMHCGSGKFLPFAFWDLGVLLWDATGI